MNGLNELVYRVTQQAGLLEKIISEPSLLKTYADLTDKQIEAFFEVTKNGRLLTHLQNLSSFEFPGFNWSGSWGGKNLPHST